MTGRSRNAVPGQSAFRQGSEALSCHNRSQLLCRIDLFGPMSWTQLSALQRNSDLEKFDIIAFALTLDTFRKKPSPLL